MKRKVSLIIGLLLFLLAILLPYPGFSFEGKVAVGCVLWMGYWWITLPVSAAVSAFIPICVNALLPVMDMNKVIGCYFSEIVILLLGADLISLSWEETGLDKRISLKALCLIGPSATQQIIVWFILAVVLSALLPNAVVCAIMTPVAFSMLKYILKDENVMAHPISSVILASIAWGAGIGGLGTPLGGAMNLISVGYLEELLGHEFIYTSWVVRMIPFLVLLTIVDIIYLLIIKPKGIKLNGTKEYFASLYASLPKMDRDEKWSLFLFLSAVVLSFGRELFADVIPGLKPAYIFLICGMLCFIVPKKDGKMLLDWKEAQKKIGWSLLFLFAGGLAVGNMISGTGAASSIAVVLSSLDLDGGFITILILVTMTIVLAEVSSNTAAAAISVPIVISLTGSLGLDPVPYIFVISAAFNIAYMLPTSIRAIPVGYGLAPAYLFKNGMVLTLLGILLISVAGYILLPWMGL